MNNSEAYPSLLAEGLTARQAEDELSAARHGRGRFLSWSFRFGYDVRWS